MEVWYKKYIFDAHMLVKIKENIIIDGNMQYFSVIIFKKSI